MAKSKRTFVCLDCKSECECSPVGKTPKCCEACRKAAKLKDQELRRAAKGAKPRGRKPARAARPIAGDLGGMLDERIREIARESVNVGEEQVQAAVDRALDARLNDLVDARIRAMFAGRAKA